jgi:hypothetical protein
MADPGTGFQGFLSKTPNKLSFQSSNMDSDSESGEEMMTDYLYEHFLVAEMFSDEFDMFIEESEKRVSRTFRNDGISGISQRTGIGGNAEAGARDCDYEYEDVMTDYRPQTPGEAAAEKPSNDYYEDVVHLSNEESGAGDQPLFWRSASRSLEKNVVSDCVPSEDSGKLAEAVMAMAAAGAAGGDDSGNDEDSQYDSFDIVQHPRQSGDSVSSPTAQYNNEGSSYRAVRRTAPSGRSLTLRLRHTGVAEGGPEDKQAELRSRSQGSGAQRPSRQLAFPAVAQHDHIILAARKLAELGDDIMRKYEAVEDKPSYWEKLMSCIRSATGAIDATLIWVEHNSMLMMENMKDMQKQEGILRGLTLLTGT